MVCHKCGQPAIGICKFCGRGVCKDHYSTDFPTTLAMYLGRDETPKAVVVSNVLWCGECDPQPEPIAVPEFY
jgi:hypothetical protein